MSNYETTLEEARGASNKGAKFYIPLLYDILVNEENKTADDARKIIEHDLIEYWSKATVRKFLPQETKNEDKVKAAKASHENRKPIVITTDGSQESAGINPAGSNPEQPTGQHSESSSSEEQEQKEADEIEQQYKEEQAAIPKDDMNSVSWRTGLVKTDIVMDAIERELPKLRNRGWRTIEITIRAV